MPHISRLLAVAALVAAGTLPATWPGPALADDAATFLATCEKDKGADAKPKCACVAAAIEKAFKDKQRAFAFQSLSLSAGELAKLESGLTEAEEDAVTDTSFEAMQSCGLLK